jgi:pimeloyl-ACP methyl ester carboxylesterase
MARRANHTDAAHTARSLSIGGHSLRYVDGGARDASRVLLLFNGIGASVETAGRFIAAFRRARVIAFDVPGVGESPAPLLPYRMCDVARLATGLLDELGIGQADVFGVSWGGAAAQEFALRHPERCRTLTLAATCAGLVMVPGRPDGVLRLERDLLSVHASAMRGANWRGYLYQLFALWGWTSWHRLHRLHAPTLVLMGADDPIVPPVNGRIVASRLPRATLEIVDCGHLFMMTRPAETARRVERFMAEHPPTRARALH